MEMLVCDTCKSDLQSQANWLEVAPQGIFRVADDETVRHFCDWKCVSEFKGGK